MSLRISKNKLNLTVLLLILSTTAFLRFYHLGYSDYIKDEHRTFFDQRHQGTFWNYALEQRKGPVQYLLAFVPRLLVGNFTNELAQRVPFALANVISVFIFYLLTKKITQDERVALTSAALLAFNGFISGFGRIAQYQNLNLLFSFLSLLFYYRMTQNKNVLNAALGSVFLVFSGLSHWDVIFIAVPLFYLWIKFLRDPLIISKTKILSLGISATLVLVLSLPFLIPYLVRQPGYEGNMSYLNRRIAFNGVKDLEFDFLIKLYNPFLSYYVYLALGVLGLIFYRKSWMFLLWFLVDYLLFYFFAAKPGTHVYNFLIPLFVLCSIGFWSSADFLASRNVKVVRQTRPLLIIMLLIIVSFMFYQSYRLFVENHDEYPWEDEKILFWTAKKVQHKEALPLFGFPHYRAWKKVEEFVAQENAKNGTFYTYDTNEDESNISFYMSVDKSREQNGYYFVGIKRPISFMQDWKPKQIKNKTTVKEIEVNQETVVNIYKVLPQTK